MQFEPNHVQQDQICHDRDFLAAMLQFSGRIGFYSDARDSCASFGSGTCSSCVSIVGDAYGSRVLETITGVGSRSMVRLQLCQGW